MSEPSGKTTGRKQPARRTSDDRVTTWPNLTGIAYLAMLATLFGLLVMSAAGRAPLEGPADPTETPNPSKAPWYFVGLQEMLVYFDPWIAGVAAPTLIVVGLMALPYLDPNPGGVGTFDLRGRKFAAAIFLSGFVAWHALIFIGLYFRGPGWVFFPGGPSAWDPQVEAHETFRNFHEFFGFSMNDPWPVRETPGFLAVAAWFALFAWVPRRLPGRWPGLGRIGRFHRSLYERMGRAKYLAFSFLFACMMGFFIKIPLRLAPFIVLKYVLTTPYFNI